MRERIQSFVRNGEELLRLCRRTTYLGHKRLATITSKFDEEVVYLTWFYDRKLKGYRSQNTKNFKYYSGIFKKLKALKDGREVRQDEPLGQPPPIVVDFSRLARAGYMLEFTIWQYFRTQRKLKALLKESSTINLHAEPRYINATRLHRDNLRRLTFWSAQLQHLSTRCFVGTGFVDTERLYQVDQEGFNRDVLEKEKKMKQMKENDDLTVFMHASPSTPATDKASKRKSPKKKKAKKGAKSAAIGAEAGVLPEVFEKLEKQREMVELMLAADPESGNDHRELSAAQTAELARRAEPYHDMGERFPKYDLQTTREEMQRLVIKEIGIEDARLEC